MRVRSSEAVTEALGGALGLPPTVPLALAQTLLGREGETLALLQAVEEGDLLGLTLGTPLKVAALLALALEVTLALVLPLCEALEQRLVTGEALPVPLLEAQLLRLRVALLLAQWLLPELRKAEPLKLSLGESVPLR